MKYILIAIILVSQLTNSSAQSNVEYNVIKALSAFRSSAILNNIEATQELASTLQLYDSLGISKELQDELIFNMQYSKNVIQNETKFILKTFKKEYKKYPWHNKLTTQQIDVITSNPDICDFINLEVISQEYPFRISNSKIFKELDFYDLNKYESLADIGAGKGVFTTILYMAAQSNKIYYTEIEDDLILYFYNFFNKGHILKNDSEIIMVKGKKKETKLPEPVDKIVLRSTFHHFKDKKAMLKSIKGSLKKDGKLFIKEYIDDQSGAEKPCRHVLTESEKKNGFRKLDLN